MAKEKEVKQLNISDTIKELEKKYGKGTVMDGNKLVTDYDSISTGSIGLDHALGIGGVPATGKIIEIFGWESSGKSTITQTIVGNAQKKYKAEGKGKKVLYVDGENSLEKEYSTALGVDLDDLLIIQLDEFAGEGAYDKMEALVKTGEIGLVVIDSYNSLQPKRLIDGSLEDASMGVHARMQGAAVMKANAMAQKYGTTFIFIGQLREKIGVMFGSPETTQGGNALKFYSHIRMEVSRSVTKDNSIMNGEDKIGNKVTVKVIKNKVAPPFTKAVFDVLYGVGIDKVGEVIRIGKDLDILKVRAGVITYKENKYEEADFRELITNNPQFKEDIVKDINNILKDIAPVQEKPEE